MDIRSALKEQYHGALAMLRQCIDKCPDDLWVAGEQPRSYWQIVGHTVFFTDLYSKQENGDYGDYAKYDLECAELWGTAQGIEPYPKSEILQYLDHVEDVIDERIDTMDLDTERSGFPWYPDVSKLSHQLLNLRHIQGHVGQLSELLMARGIDIDWIDKGSRPQTITSD